MNEPILTLDSGNNPPAEPAMINRRITDPTFYNSNLSNIDTIYYIGSIYTGPDSWGVHDCTSSEGRVNLGDEAEEF